ncbi:hypothetical protein ACH427_08425 [Streptomyces sp. NPDC020379]|uniref:hypothetical protein n=1 Tax=Streptomyces sp. NPDC020379 TaxID=3365071 RepID=UPI0037A91BAB
MTLKPATTVHYHHYVVDDLIPALGKIRLDDLGYGHIAAMADLVEVLIGRHS